MSTLQSHVVWPGHELVDAGQQSCGFQYHAAGTGTICKLTEDKVR